MIAHFLNLRWREGYRFVSELPAHVNPRLEDVGASLQRQAEDEPVIHIHSIPGVGIVGTLFGRVYLYVDKRKATYQHSIIVGWGELDTAEPDAFDGIFGALYGRDKAATLRIFYNLLASLEYRDGGPLVRALCEPHRESLVGANPWRAGYISITLELLQRWPAAADDLPDGEMQAIQAIQVASARQDERASAALVEAPHRADEVDPGAPDPGSGEEMATAVQTPALAGSSTAGEESGDEELELILEPDDDISSMTTSLESGVSLVTPPLQPLPLPPPIENLNVPPPAPSTAASGVRPLYPIRRFVFGALLGVLIVLFLFALVAFLWRRHAPEDQSSSRAIPESFPSSEVLPSPAALPVAPPEPEPDPVATISSAVPAAEKPGDGVDQDGDGVDNCYVDDDGDGRGSGEVRIGRSLRCRGAGESSKTGDCDDKDKDVYPGAPTLCDEKTNDCDNTLGEGWPDQDRNGVPDCAQQERCPGGRFQDQSERSTYTPYVTLSALIDCGVTAVEVELSEANGGKSLGKVRLRSKPKPSCGVPEKNSQLPPGIQGCDSLSYDKHAVDAQGGLDVTWFGCYRSRDGTEDCGKLLGSGHIEP